MGIGPELAVRDWNVIAINKRMSISSLDIVREEMAGNPQQCASMLKWPGFLDETDEFVNLSISE